jgi:hypothetical protein
LESSFKGLQIPLDVDFYIFLKPILKYNSLNFLLIRSGMMMQQKLHVTLLTGRTIEQGVGKEYGKSSPEYYAVVSDATTSIGTPSFKGTPAEVEPAPDKPVLSIQALLKKEFGR